MIWIFLRAGPLELLAEEELSLKWKATEASQTLGGHITRRLAVSTNTPSSAKKLPPGVTAAWFGELRIGPREKQESRLVLLDEPKNGPARLFVDSNGDGDFTNDPGATWTKKSTPGSAGTMVSIYVGEAKVTFPFEHGPREGQVGFSRRDRSDGAAGVPNELYYFREYFLLGRLKLGDKTYRAALVDEYVRGDFRGEEDPEFSGVRLFFDFNDDSTFELTRESVDVRKPFNLGGTTWEVADLTAEGEFRFQRSSKTAPEIVVAPNLNRGRKAISFVAKTTDGGSTRFPEDYKGKVVLLDFWATWCGPCLAEIPNVVQNYQKYHERGFEVLGISLDQAETVPKLAAFLKQKNMTWRQVADGKGWQAEVAQRYAVSSIPFMLLINGDTGEILGREGEVRGENLGPAIEAALPAKKKASR
ncbi:MAG TPA: TlpA disulfide reductase family protein [Verrucomicrobiae bacterium]|nr:TlpA disulfide reductase family protein [Verrucomicrobiae bacterium]